ncbi:hypothetical protein GDO81_022844 [Engystomops pustulosus]|uniref:Uncharacterized protein n=1 Tax=Engystomops pustulosus TaxID=76066 RepID=A0AAV6YLK9_ENGPU|nr:hypothetical protein GDO81_022844 [Engystomops pustulosus]
MYYNIYYCVKMFSLQNSIIHRYKQIQHFTDMIPTCLYQSRCLKNLVMPGSNQKSSEYGWTIPSSLSCIAEWRGIGGRHYRQRHILVQTRF